MAMTTRTGTPDSNMKNAGTATTAEAIPPQRMTFDAPYFVPRAPPHSRAPISTAAATMLPSRRSESS
jgi:hypothetical protein